MIPKIPFLLTRSMETGYDQYAICVPKIVKYTEEDWARIEGVEYIERK